MSKRQVLLNVIRYFTQKSPKHKIVGAYRRSTDQSKEECRAFLLTNYRTIVKLHSFSTFKEFALNYRILFDRSKPTKIIYDFKKYVMTKARNHKSNLAMSYNLVKSVPMDEQTEQQVIDFMYSQLSMPHVQAYRTQPYFFKKRFILDYVKGNIITKEPV